MSQAAALPVDPSASRLTSHAAQPADTSATSLFDLMKFVLADPTTTPEQKKLLIDELRKNNSSAADRWTHRGSLWILGGAIVVTILSVAILAGLGAKIPEGLLSLGTGVVGALAGLMAPGQKATTDNTHQ
jgi:hypothetical protein